MKKKIVALLAGSLLAVSLIGCSNANEDSVEEPSFDESSLEETISKAEQVTESEEATESQDRERDMDFETGVGLPTFNELSEYFRNVAGMTLEANDDGSITIYGPRTGEEIGEIIFGDEGDDYDMMLIIDKEAGDKEEGDSIYCLKNALASVLRVFNGYEIDDPFEDAMDIIEYGTQSSYLYGMEEYLVGNIDNGASYAIKIVSNS